MSPDSERPAHRKISKEFAARLAQLAPTQRVRAILVLDVKHQGRDSKQRMSRKERKDAIEALRAASGGGLAEIDETLERYNGTRLAPTVDALGCVPIEATADGIKALAGCTPVKAILEDQKIAPLPKPRR